jgi:hypothetical protein
MRILNPCAAVPGVAQPDLPVPRVIRQLAERDPAFQGGWQLTKELPTTETSTVVAPAPSVNRIAVPPRSRVAMSPEEDRIYHLWKSELQMRPGTTYEQFAERFSMNVLELRRLVDRVGKRLARQRGQ